MRKNTLKAIKIKLLQYSFEHLFLASSSFNKKITQILTKNFFLCQFYFHFQKLLKNLLFLLSTQIIENILNFIIFFVHWAEKRKDEILYNKFGGPLTPKRTKNKKYKNAFSELFLFSILDNNFEYVLHFEYRRREV